MAVVKWTGLVTAMKGKIRGSVMQLGAGGQIMRSNRQFNQHSNMRWRGSKVNIATVANNWRSLTPTQMLAWASATSMYPVTDRFGNTHYPSAYTLYMRLNNALQYHSGSMIMTPLAPVAFSNISPIEVAVGGGPTFEAISNINTQTYERVIISASSPMSYGRQANAGQYVKIGSYDFSGTRFMNITTDYEAVYGVIPVGCQYWFQWQILNLNTGQLSPVLITNALT
jgi:hypothetical protein